ncbi:MAG: FHA domain-containing protein [Planctomycetota bacterium]
MPRLTIQEAGEPVEYDILDPEVTIGRGAANSVQLTANGVSKHHAVVRRVRGRMKLVDLESLNGTVVNGRALNQRWLMDGDTIRVGEATLTYAADGAEQGPPVAKVAKPKVVGAKAAAPPVAVKAVPAKPAAVPAKPAAVPVKPVPAEPAAPAKPAAVAAPAVAATLAPTAPVRSAPTRTAPTRRRDTYDDGYDDGYDDERPGRRAAARKNNNPWIVLGVIGGALVFGALIFTLFGGTASSNRDILHEGIDIVRGSKAPDRFERALRLAEQKGDPGGKHYDLLRDEMDSWRQHMLSLQTQRLEDESREFWDKQILRKSWSPTLHPVDAMTDTQTVQRIHEWMDRYPGTLAVKHLVAGEDETMQHYRQLLREHPDPEYTSYRAKQEVTPAVEALVASRFYHKAIERLGDLEGIARLRMTREAWTDLEATIRQWKNDILNTARTEVEADMRSARDLIDTGQRQDAIRKLQTILRRYPRELVPDAPEMLEKIR